jgi:hypothetical protein
VTLAAAIAPDVAVTVTAPVVPPAVTGTLAIPCELLAEAPASCVAGPYITTQFLVTPAMPFPNASEALTWGGRANGVFTAGFWISPPALVSAAGAPGIPIAEKTWGEPVAPTNCALAFCVHDVRAFSRCDPPSVVSRLTEP